MTLRMIDCFSGIGGFSLAARWLGGFETVQFVEREPFCQRILQKHWPSVPIHDDICTYEPAAGTADVVVGGFPCQDISQAGKGAGLSGDRSGLFYELLRVVRLVGLRYIVLENVAAITYRGMDDVLGALAEAGFDAEWACIPASAVGACHRRDRWWCVAYANNSRHTAEGQEQQPAGTQQHGGLAPDSKGLRRGAGPGSCPSTAGQQGQRTGDGATRLAAYAPHMLGHGGSGEQPGQPRGRQKPEHRDRDREDAAYPIGVRGERRGAAGDVAGTAGAGEADRQQRQRDGHPADHCGTVADPMRQRLEGPDELGSSRSQWPAASVRLDPDWRSFVSEPVIRRGDDGFPGRVDRLKALGNAVVPQVAMIPLARVLELAEMLEQPIR